MVDVNGGAVIEEASFLQAESVRAESATAAVEAEKQKRGTARRGPARKEEVAPRTKVITLPRLQERSVVIPIIGVTGCIPHRWSEKAVRMMEQKQTEGKRATTTTRAPKDPDEEREATLYRFEDGRIGLPAVGFKAAMVEGCRFYDGLAMTDARRMFYVHGEYGKYGDILVDVFYSELIPRRDMPRNATGVADIRYRYELKDWSANIKVSFVETVIAVQSIYALLDAGGRNGIGDWRPGSPKSNTGTHGQWRVDWDAIQEQTDALAAAADEEGRA